MLEGDCHGAVYPDEFPIKVRKAKQVLEFFAGLRTGPILDGFVVGQVHLYATS